MHTADQNMLTVFKTGKPSHTFGSKTDTCCTCGNKLSIYNPEYICSRSSCQTNHKQNHTKTDGCHKTRKQNPIPAQITAARFR